MLAWVKECVSWAMASIMLHDHPFQNMVAFFRKHVLSTLKQQRFELWGSTYTQIFFFSINTYSRSKVGWICVRRLYYGTWAPWILVSSVGFQNQFPTNTQGGYFLPLPPQIGCSLTNLNWVWFYLSFLHYVLFKPTAYQVIFFSWRKTGR